jgi:hypothetical protein
MARTQDGPPPGRAMPGQERLTVYEEGHRIDPSEPLNLSMVFLRRCQIQVSIDAA